MEDIKCAVCGSKVEHDDTVDLEHTGSGYIEKCVGHCPKCNRQYYWENSYFFLKTIFIELEED